MASRPTVFAIVLLFVLPAAAVFPAGAQDGRADAGIRLYLEAGAFDPLAQGPPVADDLLSPDFGIYRIVQFKGPVLESWKEAVAGKGAVLFGYLPDYAWLHLPVLDHKRQIVHDGGIIPKAPGVYVIGLQFLRRRKSALIDGAGADAAELAGHLAAFLAGQPGPATAASA